jgi:hypothetical protein
MKACRAGCIRFVIVFICLALFACRSTAKREPERAAAPGDAGAPPLPALKDCPSSAHPVLPAKWTAKALLHPFYDEELLALADLTYDGSVGAIYQTNEWADGTTGSWLITATTTYSVTGPPNAPTQCEAMDDAFTAPPRDWLDASAKCVGVGPVQGRNAAWWKTRVGSGQAPPTTWYWYDWAKGTPWRVMFATPVYDRGMLGMFSFINFQQFNAVGETVLPKILQFCRKAPRRTGPLRSAADVHAVDAGAARSAAHPIPVPSRPKVDFNCDLSQLPPFASKFSMTTLMSSVAYNVPNPLPTRVEYDWTQKPPSMRTDMYNPGGKTLNAEALLLGGNGYLLAGDTCQLVLPGIPVPNWQQLDCACRAVIRNDPEWNQYPEQRVIECGLESDRVFWMWYTPAGVPIVFMETAAPVGEGTSLALADYFQFIRGAGWGSFKLPANCPSQPPPIPPKPLRVFHHGELSGSDAACHRCHQPIANR